MKKRIMLVSAIITVIAITAVALVSCASTPSKFYENFKKAESYTITSGEKDSDTSEMIYDKGSLSMITKNKDGNITTGSIAIVSEKTVAFYTYLNKSWSKAEVTTDSRVYKTLLEMFNTDIASTTVSDDDFIKQGGYWFPKGADGEALKTEAMKFTSDKAMSYNVTEKDGKKIYTLTTTMTLSGSVKAPKVG